MKKFNLGFTYVVLCVFSILAIFLSSILIDTKELLYSSLMEQLDKDKVEEIMAFQERMRSYVYLFIPLMLILKVTLISSLLYVGMLIHGQKETFKCSFRIVLNAEFVMVVGSFCTILYFWFMGNYHTLEELFTPPFSVLSLFKPSEVEPWLRYPFSLLNIFEVFYWIALIVQWKKLTGKTYGESFDFIGSTYGLGVLLWVLVIIFFTI